jgi:hypothetical protein
MFSTIVRRTHMYLALFLSPWVLMYTLSTMAMNHREHLRGAYGNSPPPFVEEAQRSYDATLPQDATPRQKAVQILRDLGLDGAHNVAKSGNDGTLVINRFDLVNPKRVTYIPNENKVVIERMEFRTPAFLERLHRRRGFQTEYAMDDIWAFTVDLFIAAMIVWVLSGLWMWWEMKLTRRMGAVFAGAGLALFVAFLVTI